MGLVRVGVGVGVGVMVRVSVNHLPEAKGRVGHGEQQ